MIATTIAIKKQMPPLKKAAIGEGITHATDTAGLKFILLMNPVVTLIHATRAPDKGARIVGIEKAKDIVKAYLNAEFQGGRHEKRIAMIHEIESR